MNILIFNWRDIKNPSSGGAEILTHEIAKQWVKLGHFVVQFSSSFPGALPEETIDGIRIIRKGYPDVRYFFCSVHFLAFWHYQRFLKGKFDIVIDEIHGIPFFTPWYVKEKKIVLICEVAGSVWQDVFGPIFGFIGLVAERFSLRFIYQQIPFLTISESTKKDLITHGIAAANITVLPVGVSLSKSKTLYKKEKNPTLVYVGRIFKQKGIEDAIIAFNKASKEIPQLTLWVIGRGDETYLDFIEDMSRRLRLIEKITFFGFVDEERKFELLSRAWILIHPSITEGWGINVIEANAVGTPAIGYNVGGLRNSIKQGKTGLLTKKNNPKDLSEEIVRLFNDKALYRRLTQESKIWARKFSWEKAARLSLSTIKHVHEK